MTSSRDSGSPGAADALAQLSFVIQEMLGRLAGEHDLSPVQTRLLGILRDREPTMNQLAGILRLDKSSVTGLVERAERRGLVTRRPSAADRRVVLVKLTRRGRMLVSKVAAAFGSEVEEFLGVLDEGERTTLASMSGRLVETHAGARGIDLSAVGPNA